MGGRVWQWREREAERESVKELLLNNVLLTLAPASLAPPRQNRTHAFARVQARER